MKITVVGTGYVGLSNAILFAQHNEVTALEIIEEKVNLINQTLIMGDFVPFNVLFQLNFAVTILQKNESWLAGTSFAVYFLLTSCGIQWIIIANVLLTFFPQFIG